MTFFQLIRKTQDYLVSIKRFENKFSIVALILFFIQFHALEGKIDTIGLILILIAILPWLVPFLGTHFIRANLLSGELEFRQQIESQGERIKKQEEKQKTIESKVRVLQFSLKGIVTKFELPKLEGLAKNNPFMVNFSWHMIREIEHLDSIGYVEPLDGIRGINAISDDFSHRDGGMFNLKDYIKITNDGLAYLKLLDELQQYSLRQS